MAHAIAVPMQSGPFVPPRLDGSRIAANAGTIAINAALLMLLLVPLSAPQWKAPETEDRMEAVPVVPIRPRIPPPVTFDEVHKPKPLTTPQPVRQQVPPVPPADVVVDSQPGDLPVVASNTVDTIRTIEPTLPTPASQLEALSAPPPAYPGEAIREGLTGTVELEILVGIDGRPVEARVVRSSGHRVLDQAARRGVMRWTFVPATRDGQPVQALGRVPIEFNLTR